MGIRVFDYNEELDAFAATEDYFHVSTELGLQEWNSVVWIGRLFSMDNDFGEHWQDDFDLRDAKTEEADGDPDHEQWFVVDPSRFVDSNDGPCHSEGMRKAFWTEVLKSLELSLGFLIDLARENEERYHDLSSHGIDLEDRIEAIRNEFRGID